MSSYTITIAPDDRARATTTLRVEVSDAAARVTELLVRAGDGDGLTAGQLPAVDLDQLLRALLPARAAAILQAAPSAPADAQVPAGAPAPDEVAPDEVAPAEVAPAEVAPADAVAPDEPEVTPQPAVEPVASVDDRQAAAGEPAPAASRTSRSTAGVRPRRGGTAAKKTATAGTRRTARTEGSTKDSKAAPTKAAQSTRATKSAPTKSAPTKSTKATKATAATNGTAKKSTAKTSAPRERAYRRAPEDLAEVYQQAGSTAAVADHYGVPRHTAYGWIRKLNRATAA